MMRMHGGDWSRFAEEYGVMPLDFSASISPLGLPAGVQQAVIQNAGSFCVYPDPQCRNLRRGISDHLGIPEEQILCGNGASDLIWRMVSALKPRRALVTAPTFSEYEDALQAAGCAVMRFPLAAEQNFRLDETFLSWIDRETELVILCQPNNPAGVGIPAELLHRILETCVRYGAFLAVDECFLDFMSEPGNATMLPYLDTGRLLILRAFTKFYAMAGLRLGYCMSSDRTLLAQMQASGPAWNVSSAAQTAGLAALEEKEYARNLRNLIPAQRRYLQSALDALGLHVIPGEANYLLFFGPEELGEQLRMKGILIRDCRDFYGLGPGWFRVAVMTENENRTLIAAMKEVL